LIKEITLAARQGGGDPNLNAKLRLLLEKGRAANMPIDNAERAILRGTGELPGVQYEEQTYEGYGPNGVAIIVDTLTDNKNRTVAELRRIFMRHEGVLAENGTVSWMFEKLGVIHIPVQKNVTEDQLLELLFEYEVQDIIKNDEGCVAYCSVKSFFAVKQAIESVGITISESGIEKIPKNTVSLGEDVSEKVVALLSTLQEHDDVQEVYTTLL